MEPFFNIFRSVRTGAFDDIIARDHSLWGIKKSKNGNIIFTARNIRFSSTGRISCSWARARGYENVKQIDVNDREATGKDCALLLFFDVCGGTNENCTTVVTPGLVQKKCQKSVTVRGNFRC